MKLFQTILLSSSIFLLFVPQYPSQALSVGPKVKSASIHYPKLPQQTSSDAPNITASAVYVLDINSNTSLYQRNPNKALFPASLTKIMTAMVALDHYSKDQVLSVKSANHSIGNTMKLKSKDNLTALDLIYGLLVSSGNDAALTLAENYPGGYSSFVSAMNQKAKEIGLKKTNFSNVSGVEDINHFSSAYDLTQLTLVALKNPIFRQAVNTSSKEIISLKGNRYSLTSTNKLLKKIPGVIGVKTGWTPEAGECLITLVNQGNRPILITILGSKDRFRETETIINWVYKSFSWQ